MLSVSAQELNDLTYYLPDDLLIAKLANFFATFSDPTRLKVLSALSVTPMCVSDVAEVLKINQTTVSHQLKLLRDSGTVTFRRQGKVLYYRLCDEKISQVLLLGVEYLGY